MAAIDQLSDVPTAESLPSLPTPPVLLVCPDARPPAYQAAIGFTRAGLLDRFITGFYYREKRALDVCPDADAGTLLPLGTGVAATA